MNTSTIGTPGQWYQVGIYLRGAGKLIGDCGLRVPESDTSRVEVGIALDPTMQRRGYATEALRAFMDYLLTSLRKQTVFGVVDAANVRSAALMVRVGMRRVGRCGEQRDGNFEEFFESVKEKH
jgi:aminoglycoside 6'-N-acetyltransferase